MVGTSFSMFFVVYYVHKATHLLSLLGFDLHGTSNISRHALQNGCGRNCCNTSHLKYCHDRGRHEDPHGVLTVIDRSNSYINALKLIFPPTGIIFHQSAKIWLNVVAFLDYNPPIKYLKYIQVQTLRNLGTNSCLAVSDSILHILNP